MSGKNLNSLDTARENHIEAVLVKTSNQYGKSSYDEDKLINRENYIQYLEKEVTKKNVAIGNCYHLIYILAVVIMVMVIIK